VEAPPPEPPDPRVGSVLQDRYRLIEKLASGAMGVVYRGERVQLGRPVAVKFLHPWIATQRAFISRFDNEARAMSRLQHPHCVSVIDFGVEGTPYLVMDFVTGRTLRQVLEGGRLEVGRALALARQLLAGLGHAHAQGIIHRDLKPENLILTDEPGLGEHLRILDFGLAKLRDGPAMTAGLAVGTPSYMSPEQTGAEGAIDARTDLYAVGVLLFEILTGRKPFQSENVGELLLMHREQPPPLLRGVAPAAGLSAELEAVVGKALSKFADDRYQSAAELVAALDATPEGRSGGAASPGATAPKPAAATLAMGAAPPRASGLPAPAAAAPGARAVPAPPAADATIVESASAIRRIVDGDAGASPRGGAASASSGGPRDRKMVWAGVALGAAAIAALLVGRAMRKDVTAVRGAGTARSSGAVAGGATRTAPVANPAPSSPAAAEVLEQARKLLALGQWEQAVTTLEGARAEHPDDAEIAYLLATVALEHRRWSEGVASAQLAARKNPTLKSDPDLIKAVIQALASDTVYERAQSFLRSSGSAGTPFIKEAAHRDPNPKIRDRAAALLGEGRSAFGWSSSRSSGGSVFHR
jgi:serine/threonine-protein kinase